MEVGLNRCNRPFARWRHFTNMTRILHGFALPNIDMKGKNEKDCHLSVNSNNNNTSFIYTGDIYQHYTTLVLTRCPVNTNAALCSRHKVSDLLLKNSMRFFRVTLSECKLFCVPRHLSLSLSVPPQPSPSFTAQSSTELWSDLTNSFALSTVKGNLRCRFQGIVHDLETWVPFCMRNNDPVP